MAEDGNKLKLLHYREQQEDFFLKILTMNSLKSFKRQGSSLKSFKEITMEENTFLDKQKDI